MKMLDSDEQYIDQFAPSYRILESQVAQDKADIEKQENIYRQFCFWRNTINSNYQII